MVFQMGVPSLKAQTTVSVWKTQDVPPRRELEKVWVHLLGVPYTVRHLLGPWALGSLIGATLDVDLVTLWSRGIVRIQVGMLNSEALEKCVDESGPYIGAPCVFMLEEYAFFFRREPSDFAPDPNFIPLF